MRPQDPDDELSRLTDAVEAFLSLGGSSGSGDAERAARLLDERPELREFLEPMLDGGPDANAAPARGPGAHPSAIGPYRIVRELGRGGMGVVYEAEHGQLDRRAALKVLPGLLSLAPRRIQRFLREARIVARLDHPGLARVYDVGETDGTWWFAMELVDGTTLRERLRVRRDRRETPLGLAGCDGAADEAAELGVQVADALAHAHAHGLVHRDVKPQNILIDRAGRARLVDFGLAKDTGELSLTGTGDFAGTPYYASPEQIEAARLEDLADETPGATTPGRDGAALDGRSDIFSLGCVLYEILAARRPFDGASTGSILRAVVATEPPDLAALDPTVPRPLATIVHKALEKDPRRRYHTAAAFAEDLRRFRQGRPILARPVPFVVRATRWAARHRAWAAALALGFGLFVVVPVVSVFVLEAKNAALARERDLANQHFERARRVLDRLFVRVADAAPQMQELRMHELRQGLLEDARGYYEEMRDAAGPDAGLTLEAARVHGRAGRAHFELGSWREATDALGASIDCLRVLPPDRVVAMELASAHAARGQALLALAGASAAEADFAAAETLWHDLLQHPGDDAAVPVRTVADSIRSQRLRLAHYRAEFLRLEAPDTALRLLDEAAAAYDGLAGDDEESVPEDQRHDRVRIDTTRCAILLEHRDPDAARPLLRAARERLDSLPESAARLLTEHRVRFLEARVLQLSGDVRAADALRSLLQDQVALWRSAPRARNAAATVARTADALARHLLEQWGAPADGPAPDPGAGDDLRDEIASVCAIATQALEGAGLVDGPGAAFETRRTLAIVRSTRAAALSLDQRAAPDEVRNAFAEATDLLRSLVEARPTDPSLRNSLSGALHNRARFELRLAGPRGRRDRDAIRRALATFHEGARIQREILTGSDAARFAPYQVRHLLMVANLELELGNRDGSAAASLEAVGLPMSPQQRVQFARSLAFLAPSLPAARARACREGALGALERAVAEEPRAAVGWIRSAPEFRELRGEKRFQALLRGGSAR